jgi:hypothetical protein
MPGESERLGELLVAEGVVTQEDITKAVSDSGIKGSPLAWILEGSVHVKRAELAAFLATNFRIPVADDLRKLDIAEGAAKLIPEEIARKHELIPICRLGDLLVIAKANYYNRAALNELRTAVGLKVKVIQADEGQVRAALERIYKGKKGDLPAPSAIRKETARMAPATVIPAAPEPPLLEEVAAFEAIPLISPAGGEDRGSETAPRRGQPGRAAASRGGGYDDVIEIMDAIRLSPQDYTAALRDPYARLVTEFDDVHQLGRPVPPARVS